jgi:hypothetical protein
MPKSSTFTPFFAKIALSADADCYSLQQCRERKVQTGIKPGMEHKFRLVIASFENLTHTKVFEQNLNQQDLRATETSGSETGNPTRCNL